MKNESRELVRVCTSSEIPEGSGKSFRVNGAPIAVYRIGGRFYAAHDICTHEHEHLSEGWLEGETIECPRHGAQFSLKTGEALTLPATDPIEVYPVELQGDEVMVVLPSKQS